MSIDRELLNIITFSMIGTCAGGVLSLLFRLSNQAILTLLFILQILLGLPPNHFAMFITAGYIGLLLVQKKKPPLDEDRASMGLDKRLILLVLASFGLILWHRHIAELLIFTKAAGIVNLLWAVLIMNLAFSGMAFTNALCSLALGMLAAFVGTYLTVRLTLLPLTITSWDEGKTLVVLLAGVYLLPPLISGEQPGDQHSPCGWQRDLFGLLMIFVSGIGITPLSIILFAILNQENVNFGAMTVLEHPLFIWELLATIVCSAGLIFIGRILVARFSPLPLAKIVSDDSLWIFQALTLIIVTVGILTSGLGIVYLYFTLAIAVIAQVLEHCKLSKQLFLIGLLYSPYIQYLLHISDTTGQTIVNKTLIIPIIISILLVVVRRFQPAGRNS